MADKAKTKVESKAEEPAKVSDKPKTEPAKAKVDSQKWKYDVAIVEATRQKGLHDEREKAKEVLNSYGKKGWELVSVISKKHANLFYFKKPLKTIDEVENESSQTATQKNVDSDSGSAERVTPICGEGYLDII